jgi:phospholipid/cholesterol/gamma-HCH transport system substrate-binding protein
MARLSTEAKLGLFVLLGIILLAYMSLRVGEWEWVGGYDVKATFDSVAGLKKDVPVEIAGVEVGRVDKISLRDSKAEVTMRISEGVSIPEDSTAVIQTKGVLGEKYIEIIPPKPIVREQSPGPEARYIQPGGEIKRTRSAADIDTLLRTLGEVGEDIKSITHSLSKVIGGPQGEQNIRDIVDNVRLMTENLSAAVAENRAQFREMIDNFAAFAGDLRQMSAENRQRVTDTLANFEAASSQLERTMATVERLAEDIEQGKGVMGKLVTDQKTADDLETTLASLRDISQKVNEGKGTLGKLINDETTVNELNKTLKAISSYQQKFEDFKTYIGFRGEYLTRQGDGKGYLSLKVQPKKDKYYLVEILRDPAFTLTSKTSTTVTTDGVTKTTMVQEQEADEIKFSLQIAKRFYDAVLRGGVLESSAGVAADYYLFDDSLRLSVEAFDFGRNEGAHYKAYANYNFWKYFFVTAGYDDFGVSSRRTPLVGGGITFLDEDIKYLLTGAPVAVSAQ